MPSRSRLLLKKLTRRGTIGIIFTVLGLALLSSLFGREESLGKKAGRIMDATLARDVDEVAGSFCQIDRDVSNLDDDRSRRVVNEIIFPRLEGYGPAVKTRLMESPAGEWGAAIAVIEGKEGEADLNVGTTPTENGPCVQLEGWLRQGWRMDAGGRNTLDVLLSGFRRDRPKLEAIGILKIVGLDGKTRTLDQLDRYYQGYK